MTLNSLILNCDGTGEQMKIARLFKEYGIDSYKKDDDYIEFKLRTCEIDTLIEVLKQLKNI